MNTRKNGTRREFKNAIKDYVKSLANKMVVHHYTVLTEDGYTVYYTLDKARAAKHQFDGTLFEILPIETGFGAVVRERG